MNWKFWKKAEKPSLEWVDARLQHVCEKIEELESRLKVTEAMAMRTQTKVYRDIDKGVVYDDPKINIAQPLTNYGPGDIIPENTQWG